MEKLISRYVCVAVMAVSALTACDLDSKVYSNLSETNFPQTEEDARSMITGIYGNFKCNSGGVDDSSINGSAGRTSHGEVPSTLTRPTQ